MNYRIYIIACEASGDNLGAWLMHALKACNHSVEIKGIGGHEMQAAGLDSLFDITPLSVMGIVEILPKLITIRKLLYQTIQDIKKFQPHILITIDSSGFNKRVVKAVQSHTDLLKVHYVAPMVWAWKPKRTKEFAKLYDLLLCLLPFEPEWFIKEGLESHFVGHPICNHRDLINAQTNHSNPSNNIALIPGSRISEVKRHLPIMLDLAKRLSYIDPTLRFIIPVLPATSDVVANICMTTNNMKPDNVELIPHHDRFNQLANSRLAIATSGSVTLELACLNIATIVMYRMHPVTMMLVKIWAITPYCTIINYLANKIIIPELLDKQANIKSLLKHALHLLDQKNAQHQIKAQSKELLKLKAPKNKDPTVIAVEAIFEKLKKKTYN